MCIFKSKSELEKLKSEIERLQLQAEKDAAVITELKEEIAEQKRLKALLLRKIETLMLENSTTEAPTPEDKEFVTTEDKEFITAPRKANRKTGDNEFIVTEETVSKEEAILLAKELQHCWSLRMAHDEDKAGGFSFIEWGGVAGNISRGLRAYVKPEVDEYEQQDIDWMLNMFAEFDGKL